MSLRTSDFDYELPQHLIALQPAAERDQARMLVVHRKTGTLEHRTVKDFPDYLRDGDLTVLNDTRVMPARVFSSDGRVELLLLEQESPTVWRSLVRPGKRMRTGHTVQIDGVTGLVEEVYADGDRRIRFESVLDLERIGRLPLPPYIERELQKEDWERYQTVYARESGSVAAPTAGLHFTPALLSRIRHAFLTLHVGVGTFRPVQNENPEEHPMHSERFRLTATTAEAIRQSARVIAVGTTTVRVLETVASQEGGMKETEGRTKLFIRPPYEFRLVGGLLTNFHLPKSTLLMLVSAFAGRELVLEAYREAVREEYRFYSYGDCMLIV
jgi:S-adenosylmethionine:tRNA ribosyltransferase-isomerase